MRDRRPRLRVHHCVSKNTRWGRFLECFVTAACIVLILA